MIINHGYQSYLSDQSRMKTSLLSPKSTSTGLVMNKSNQSILSLINSVYNSISIISE